MTAALHATVTHRAWLADDVQRNALFDDPVSPEGDRRARAPAHPRVRQRRPAVALTYMLKQMDALL